MFGIFGPFGQERDRKQREIKDAGLGLLKSVQAIPGVHGWMKARAFNVERCGIFLGNVLGK